MASEPGAIYRVFTQYHDFAFEVDESDGEDLMETWQAYLSRDDIQPTDFGQTVYPPRYWRGETLAIDLEHVIAVEAGSKS